MSDVPGANPPGPPPEEDYELNEGDGSSTVKCSALLAELEQSYREQCVKFHSAAELNEKYINGEQWYALGTTWLLEELDFANPGAKRITRNLLRGLAQTWAQRLTEDRPDIKAWPNVAGGDVASADVANAVLDYLHQLHDMDDMMWSAAMLVQPHSAVAFKVWWDPHGGKPSPGYALIDEAGQPHVDESGQPVIQGVGEPEGEVRWDIVSIFNYGTDGAEDIADSRWVFIRDVIDKWDAKHLWEQAWINAGYTAEDCDRAWGMPVESRETSSWLDEKPGVPLYEIWYRPDKRFPKGLFCMMVGGKVVDCRDYPYEHGELPLAVWKCGPRRGSAFGSTHLDDALPIQLEINKTVLARSRLVEELGNIKVLGPSSIQAQIIQAENRFVACDDPELSQSIRYLQVEANNPLIETNLADQQQALYTVFGVSEISSGATEPKSGTPARGIAYLDKLDSSKQSGAARSLGKALLRVMRQSLKLYQQYVKAPRMVQIAGPQNQGAVQQFIGSDVAGVDVRLEPMSGLERYRAAIAASSQQKAQAGQISPAEGAEEGRTGLDETVFQAAQRSKVQQQIVAIMKGYPQAPLPDVDPQIALGELLMAMQLKVDGRAQTGLVQLYAAYQQRVQPPQQPQQQPAAPSTGGPSGAPVGVKTQ